jgi:hypothetical protein
MMATILAACGSSSTSTTARTTRGFQADATPGCTPAVMVVRHAEDGTNPRGGADVLTAVGKKHAALYPELFRTYLAEPHSIGPGGAKATVCPIGKVIAIDPTPNNGENNSPGTNPYCTIKPLSESLTDLRQQHEPSSVPECPGELGTIEVKDPAGVSYSTVYNWDTLVRLNTLLNNGTPTPTSTVIAWDKQGLNPSATDLSDKYITSNIGHKKLSEYNYVPLLQALPTNKAAIVGPDPTNYTPQRTDFYIFSQQDPASGKFLVAKAYKQQFRINGGDWTYTPSDKDTDIRVS